MLMKVLILVTAAFALQISDTSISTTRLSLRNSTCTLFSTNYSDSSRLQSNSYLSQYSFAGTNQILSLINPPYQLWPLPTQSILLSSPHLISLLFLLVLWPCLCCCCCSPRTHPICESCRQPQRERYTRCELKWTTYVTLSLFLILAIGAILGLIDGPSLADSYTDFACKYIAINDDLLYGRLSSNAFFVGMIPLRSQLTQFQTQLDTFFTQANTALNGASNVRTQQTSVQTAASLLYSSYSNTVYNNAFSTDGTVAAYTPITSVFKDLFLGPTTAANTILGQITTQNTLIFNQVNLALDPMITAWNTLSTKTKAGIASQITTLNTSLTTTIEKLFTQSASYTIFSDNPNTYNYIAITLKVVYGAFVGIAIIGFFGALLLACNVTKARHLLYAICWLLIVFGVLAFGLLIAISLIEPMAAQSCSYADSQFTTNMGSFLLNLNQSLNTAGLLLSHCSVPQGIISNLNANFVPLLSSMTTIATKTINFNTLAKDFNSANLTTKITDGISKINKVLNAQLLDVNDSVSLNFIEGVRQVSYPLGVTCSNVNGDSFYPSSSLYACPAGKAINTPCSNLASTVSCPLGCYEMMPQFESAAGDAAYTSNLAIRYGATCNYYTLITNLQNNWNVPRKTAMNGMLAQMGSFQTVVSNYVASASSTQSKLSSFGGILSANFNDTLNPTSGTFNGVDCRVIKESVQDARDAFCIGVVNSLSYNLTCLLLICYSLLLLQCCLVSAGVKHYNQSQKMKLIQQFSLAQFTSSDQRLTKRY